MITRLSEAMGTALVCNNFSPAANFIENLPVGKLDSTAWSTGAHMSSSNYSIMHSVSTCKQDQAVELLVFLLTFCFRDKGEANAQAIQKQI